MIKLVKHNTNNIKLSQTTRTQGIDCKPDALSLRESAQLSLALSPSIAISFSRVLCRSSRQRVPR